MGGHNSVKRRRPFGNAGSIVIFAAFMVFLGACSKDATGNQKAGDPRKKIAVPVMVGEAIEKTVPVQLRAIGNVQAYSTVSIKAQVDGQLMIVHFKEGQSVKKGDPIFTIDPRPFEAKVRQAEANLARERAQLQNARKQAERYASVVKKGFVSEEQYDQIAANAGALEAAVKADEAAVENAKLELKYCFIQSPINGSAGDVKVNQGNVVKANDNDKPMVKINQISPIYVSFSMPEQYLPEVKKHMSSRKLEVFATIPGDDERPVQGELTFMDNEVDATTGTILLKATFPNQDQALWPGQFVNVLLTLTTQAGAVVVPSQAVQTGQQGQYVFVVKPDLTVEYRQIVVGRTLDTEVVISKGITVGEKVVTDGQLRLAQGALVQIAEASGKSSEGARP